MSNKVNYMLGGSSLTVLLYGRSYTIYKTDDKYEVAKSILFDDNELDKEKKLYELVNKVANIKSKLGLVISDAGVVNYNGEVLPAALNRMIVRMYEQDVNSVDPLIKFWNKLKENPSYRPLNYLSEFVEANNIVINQEGNLILYKIVKRTSDPNVFLDLYTGKFKQEFGVPLTMPRNKVDDNIQNTCSHGLHLCSWQYLPHYGCATNGHDAIILCELNPKNIVAIPSEYKHAKIRTCEYTPIQEYKYEEGELTDVLFNIKEENIIATRLEDERSSDSRSQSNEDYEEDYLDDDDYDDDED